MKTTLLLIYIAQALHNSSVSLKNTASLAQQLMNICTAVGYTSLWLHANFYERIHNMPRVYETLEQDITLLLKIIKIRLASLGLPKLCKAAPTTTHLLNLFNDRILWIEKEPNMDYIYHIAHQPSYPPRSPKGSTLRNSTRHRFAHTSPYRYCIPPIVHLPI